VAIFENGFGAVYVPGAAGACSEYRIDYQVYGDPSPDAVRVLGMHGLPGSRKSQLFDPALLESAGVALVMPDRLGYGGSGSGTGQTVADSADMARRVADDLGWDKFKVIGHSGGVAHALACAALLPDRVIDTYCSNGMAPLHEMGPAWFEGMAPSNVEVFSPDTTEAEAYRIISTRAARLRMDSGRILRSLVAAGELSAADRDYLETSGDSISDAHDASVAGYYDGWPMDTLKLRRPWGFDLRSIQVPVHFTQSADGCITPPAHAKWMQEQIPGATLELVEGLSHFTPPPHLLGKLAVAGR
jgi:pimeloyl-ACP methyl ester carboxylesterase